MAGKLGFDKTRVDRAVALLRRIGQIVDPDLLPKPVCRDEDDDAVLALARSSSAACLVTGDDDLLVLEALEESRSSLQSLSDLRTLVEQRFAPT